MPYGSLRRYINAERHIDLDVLHDICAALGVTPLDIVGRADLSEDVPSLPRVAKKSQEQAGAPEEGD